MRILILLMAGMLVLSGCEKKGEETAKADEAAAKDEAGEAEGEADEAAADDEAKAGEDEGAAAKADEGEAIAEGDHCSQAYADMEKLIKGLEEQLGKNDGGQELPPRKKFVTACNELPEEMQKCMTFKYAMAHQKECEKAQKDLDPEVAAKVKALMGKSPGTGDDKPAEETPEK